MKLKSILITLITLNLCILCFAWSSNAYEIQTSKDDTFHVNPKNDWNVELIRSIPFKYFKFQVKPKKGSAFILRLYFTTDTSDIGKYNSPAKIKNALLNASAKAKVNMVEGKIELIEIKEKGTYGYYAIFTDKRLINATKPVPGEYLYLTSGIMRLSTDTVLAFTIAADEIHTELYQELFNYIYDLIKINNQ